MGNTLILLLMAFIWISVSSGSQSQSKIQQRKRSCRIIGGRCKRIGKACPDHLPLEKPQGLPYCKQRGRCCYPAVITFDEFTSKFNKVYKNEVEAKERHEIFQENEKAMEEHNKLYLAGNSSFIMGVNTYSDMTYDEVISELTGINGSDTAGRAMRSDDYWYVPTQLGEEPLALDYREKGAVNPIRNQGRCGSCWAFSSTSSIESNIFLKGGTLLQLSEQDLVDCSTPYGPQGCKGGWPKNAMEYVRDEGISYRDDYPYTARDDTCNTAATKSYDVIGHKQVRKDNEDELLNALVQIGPLSICMYVSSNFMSYKSGILFDTECTSRYRWVNHAMALVGYGTEGGQDYWLVRNSWGTSWGDEGYIKVARNKDNHCRIASFGDIPVIQACPSGMFGLPNSNRCFKLTDQRMSWDSGLSSCASEGLVIARPADDIAVALRKYLLETYGTQYIWIGGRGDGSKQAWELDGSAVSLDLLFPGAASEVSPDRCLAIYAFESGVSSYPNRPYTTYYCKDNNYSNRRVLCEACPSGMFMLPNSNRCFKLTDQRMSWDSGLSSCASEGLVIARPADDIAVGLRKYLLDTYGAQYIWIGGRGDGSNQSWERDGSAVSLDLLWPGAASEVSPDRCLAIYAFGSGVSSQPNRPYTTYYCTDNKYSNRRVLCEVEQS